MPTAADVRYFARQWLADESYRQTMLDADITHAGFAIAATSSFVPDPQREMELIACVNGTSSGCTRSRPRM